MDDNDNNQNGDSGQENGGTPLQEGQVTMTQPALDKLFKERADRAARSAVTSLLTELGFDDQEALKNALGEYKQIKDSQRSELEKLQDDLSTSQAKVAQLEAEAKELTDGLTEVQKRSAILSAARDESFLQESWDDVWLLVTNTAALKDKLVVEGDEVKGASAVVKEVAKLRPHWVQPKPRQSTPSGRGAAPPPPPAGDTGKTPEQPLVRF